jgi:BioD-like phosphotransacetylase family protein
VQADKIEAIRPYVTAALAKLGVALLGIFPEESTLSAPNLGQVAEEVGAQWLNARDAGIKERIHRFVIGAMAARGIIDYLEPGSLLITPGDRDDVILAAMAGASLNNGRGVAGICLTKDIMPHPRIMDMLQKSSIPVIVASHDSYTVASKIANMTIKTLPEDSDKIPLIQKIVTEHIDIQKVLAVEPASGT